MEEITVVYYEIYGEEMERKPPWCRARPSWALPARPALRPVEVGKRVTNLASNCSTRPELLVGPLVSPSGCRRSSESCNDCVSHRILVRSSNQRVMGFCLPTKGVDTRPRVGPSTCFFTCLLNVEYPTRVFLFILESTARLRPMLPLQAITSATLRLFPTPNPPGKHVLFLSPRSRT